MFPHPTMYYIGTQQENNGVKNFLKLYSQENALLEMPFCTIPFILMSVYLEVMNCLTAPHTKVNHFIKLSCQLIRIVNLKKKIIISNKLRFKKLKFWSRTHCIVFAVLGNHYNSLSFKRKRRITLKLNSSSWFSLVSRRQNVQWFSRLNTVLMSW